MSLLMSGCWPKILPLLFIVEVGPLSGGHVQQFWNLIERLGVPATFQHPAIRESAVSRFPPQRKKPRVVRESHVIW